MGSALLRLPVVAHHCKARPPCSVWPFMFLPSFSDLSEWDVAYASMRILGCGGGCCCCSCFSELTDSGATPSCTLGVCIYV